MSFTIELYSFSGENELVDKTPKLSGVVTLTGDLREATDIFDPVIKIQYIGNLKKNYLRISEFDKYYYINDIVSVINDIWELSCEEDVLMTFKEEIRQQIAVISKQEKSNYNKQYVDGTFKTIVDEAMEITPFTVSLMDSTTMHYILTCI